MTYDREAARDLYLSIFDEFALIVRDVDDVKGTQATIDFINAQFTAHHSTQSIVRDDVNGEYEVWQCALTYDSIARDEAEALFDQAWTAKHPTRTAKAPKQVEIKGGSIDWSCFCGCGQQRRTRKTMFAPGHDARFASNLIKAARSTTDPMTVEAAIDAAGQVSVKLAAKVEAALGRTGRATSTPEAVEGVVYGTIKVGRREMPAQLFTHPDTDKPHVNINDAVDGSGDWLEGEGYNDKPVAYWVKRFVPDTATPAAKPVRRKAPAARRPVRKATGDGPQALKDLLSF